MTGGVDEVFRRIDGTSTSNFLTDALGSSVALSDATGTTQTEYTYDPFEATSSSGTSSANPSQYAGRENDGTGLYYYRARYYNPGLGRFISEDPIGFASGTNFYVYANDNPLSFIDPSGLCSDPGGPGTRYCIETYIPSAKAWGFNGDNRGPDPNGGTYRTHQGISLNPDGSIDESHRPGRSIYHGLSALGHIDSCGAVTVNGRKVRGFRAHCWASDGLGYGLAPDAGYDVTVITGFDGATHGCGLVNKLPFD
jgi:RHS repeat-associated protein